PHSAPNAGDGILTMTVSSRVQESFVQFMEPVQTIAASVAPSRTMYLWCIRSGTPDTGLVGTPRLAMKAVSACEGGGTGIGLGKSTLYSSRIATPRAAVAWTAARSRSAGAPVRFRS